MFSQHGDRLRHLTFGLMALAAVGLLSGPAVAKRSGAGAKTAQDQHAATEDQLAVRSLRKHIAATELVAALELSDAQKSGLSDLVSDALLLRDEARAERAARSSELRPVLEQYLSELRRSGQPTARTVAQLQEVREANQPDREARRGARKAFRESLLELLSEEQLETLKQFRPMADAGPSDEEIAERREARAEQRGERGERPERRQAQRKEERMKKLLLSEEMLDALAQ